MKQSYYSGLMIGLFFAIVGLSIWAFTRNGNDNKNAKSTENIVLYSVIGVILLVMVLLTLNVI